MVFNSVNLGNLSTRENIFNSLKGLKGQSAIEYLMTYGWMLLVVAIAGGAVFSVVGDQSVESVNGFTGGDVQVDDLGVNTDGDLQMVLRNSASDQVDVKRVRASGSEYTAEWNDARSIGISDTGVVTLEDVQETEGSNSLDVEIMYDVGGLENLTASGTVTGGYEVLSDSITYDLTADYSYTPSNPETGETVTFTSEASPEEEISSYTWSSADTSLDQTSGSSIDHVFSSEGSYSVNLTVDDGQGNQSSYVETVDVVNIEPANFNLSGVSDNGPVTEGETVNVDYTVNNTGDVSGTQDLVLDVDGVEEDSTTVSLNSSESSSGSLTWNTVQGGSGSYSYTISTGNDSVSGSVDVDALTGPTASASVSNSNPEAGQSIEFDGSSSTAGDGGITGYDWDVDGDGSYEYSGSTVVHSYSSSGSYSVELRVTDSNGLTSTDSVAVDVQTATVAAPSVGGEWSLVEPAGAEGGYDYFFNSSTTPYGTTYGGNSSVQYTDDGFFVMKYQASNDGSGVPVSNGDAGWNNIPFNDAGGSTNAYDACEALDSQTSSYDVHLMTNREWMTVARQVAQNPTNWADNTVGSTGSSGGLYQGNHDEGGSYDRAVNLGSYPEPASSGGGTERTHVLASGDKVWDMSGDLWMWVDADEDGTKMNEDSGSKIYEKNAKNSTVSGGDGLGTDYGFTIDNSQAALRGGRWHNGDGAGVFYAYSGLPDGSYTRAGFRCSAVPVS